MHRMSLLVVFLLPFVFTLPTIAQDSAPVVLGPGVLEFTMLSDDGAHLLVAMTSGAFIFDPANPTLLPFVIEGHGERLRSAIFGDNVLITAAWDSTIIATDLPSGETRWRSHLLGTSNSLLLTADSSRLVINTGTSFPERSFVLDMATGDVVTILDPFIESVALRGNDVIKTTASGITVINTDTVVPLVDATGTIVPLGNLGLGTNPWLSFDGRRAFVPTANDTWILADTVTGETLTTLTVDDFRLERGWLRVVAGTQMDYIDLETGETMLSTSENDLYRLNIRPNGRYIPYIEDEQRLLLYNTETAENILLLSAITLNAIGTHSVIRGVWSPGGALVMQVGDSALLWQPLQDAVPRPLLQASADWPPRFSPNGSYFALGGQVFDAVTGDLTNTLPDGIIDWIDDETILIDSNNGLQAFDLEAENLVNFALPPGHTDTVTGLAFVGDALVSLDASGEMHVWDSVSGAHRAAYTFENTSFAGAWALDENRVLTKVAGGADLIIDITTGAVGLELHHFTDADIQDGQLISLDRNNLYLERYPLNNIESADELRLPTDLGLIRVDGYSPHLRVVGLPDGNVAVAAGYTLYVWVADRATWIEHTNLTAEPITDMAEFNGELALIADAAYWVRDANTTAPDVYVLPMRDYYSPYEAVQFLNADELLLMSAGFTRSYYVWNRDQQAVIAEGRRPYTTSTGGGHRATRSLPVAGDGLQFVYPDHDNMIVMQNTSGVMSDSTVVAVNPVVAYCDQINQSPDMIPSGEVVTVVYSWFAQTPQQVFDHMRRALYETGISGYQPSLNWTSDIRRDVSNDNNWTVYYYAQYDALPEGTYTVDYSLSWSDLVSDGYSNYGPGTEEETNAGSCTFTVG